MRCWAPCRGLTINEGESVALDHLAARLHVTANVAVDSKVAIRCQASGGKQPRPDIWTTSEEERELLQLSWTKGHLTRQEHTSRFGHSYAWAWFANDEADRLSGQRSKEVFSYEQAERTDAIDRAAKSRAAWLGKRCSHILQTDSVPKRSEVKFEAAPVKNRPVRKQEFNKRHALLAATQQRDPTTGHLWSISSFAKNLTVKCQECGLYAQQTDPGTLWTLSSSSFNILVGAGQPSQKLTQESMPPTSLSTKGVCGVAPVAAPVTRSGLRPKAGWPRNVLLPAEPALAKRRSSLSS